jgi:hypothetical protein
VETNSFHFQGLNQDMVELATLFLHPGHAQTDGASALHIGPPEVRCHVKHSGEAESKSDQR